MKNGRTAFCTLLLLLSGAITAMAQSRVPAVKDQLVFSAIKGSRSRIDSIQIPSAQGNAKLISGDISSFRIMSQNKGKFILAFEPPADFTGIKRAILQVTGKKTAEINLIGLSTNGLEGENEAPLSTIIDALGYKINIGWNTLANNTRPELQGDELSTAIFKKAAAGKVEIIPVARYSPDFELPFGYYITKGSVPEKHETGVLAKAGTIPEHQTLFPHTASGSRIFDPGDNEFGFYATGPTHSAYSEDVWNILLYPTYASHATRIYQLKNETGKVIPNNFLVCFEEAKNGDYNDYVFLVKNITPVVKDFFKSIFNGKDLEGWHTYLDKIGKNTDPSNNFRIEDGQLHVIGKDLGYLITESGYNNFHFKVDFKWGEKKWPPRENEKRDAGICYNIPLNEPDSIWPQSIECQIQEGDVGDFWLLGFSTIKVDGKQNEPGAHTRMIKKGDAEKPTGEWNTVEVISVNGKCVHVVNGVIVNVGEDASVKGGKLLLQSEFSEIYYRNVMIRQL